MIIEFIFVQMQNIKVKTKAKLTKISYFKTKIIIKKKEMNHKVCLLTKVSLLLSVSKF